MSVSLHELTEKIGENPSLESMMAMAGVYTEFIEILDSCALDIFKDNNISEDDLHTAVTILRSVAIADALSNGNLTRQQLAFLLSDTFENMAAIIFKLSVGLAAVEELR